MTATTVAAAPTTATQPAPVDEEADLARQQRNALTVLEMAKKVVTAGDPMTAQKMLVDMLNSTDRRARPEEAVVEL